ncbi:hypothetical protein [Aliiroseovarius sp.]|uniref:hypothetical protein n=1 Tax=Aliiroseovarius sp. TaxID=1872442 RepID=UPI0026074C7A|nr:hypothetical protein [Aliiroseovarius sp.]
MRIALTVLLIAAGLLVQAHIPETQARVPVPYEATIIPAALYLLVGEKDCNTSRVWDV